MPFAISTPFVLLIILIAFNHFGRGNWGSSVLGFMFACSLAGTAWFALGKAASDTTRDVTVGGMRGVQSGLESPGGGGGATTAPSR